ncbi:putative amino acid permease C3H1.09c [Glarea lozoyensis 74030]|uniref:Putative amino acid permease C3H1.09c n=1 Tax=Glarea lozoyensis (strain ATCC 74030 / MF5533) TaxID=1104152 RepID=H0EU63_GLAL7|nr:putative amino acid permease C3H1.09c [Glarea lozoyensis 74030]
MSTIEDPTDEERRQAEIVSRHLDPGHTADLEGLAPDEPPQSSDATQSSNGAEHESSLKLQGGDIHRDLYKISARAKPVQRSATFSHIPESRAETTASDQRLPGGFRRHFVQQKFNRSQSFIQRTPVTRNFVQFLDLYGSFAGEDLADSDDDETAIDDEEEDVEGGDQDDEPADERRPLLARPENLHAFLQAVLTGPSPLSITALIGLQLVALVPLAFIRNISKLGGVALLADVFILLGLGYIYYFDISTLAKEGISPTVHMFNPRDFTLTIGSAIFTFEGIGLILPIQSSMKEPQKFERLLITVMIIITIIFASIEIISNFPQDSKLVNAVQFLYSIAILAGDPVQLFPAMRIIEGAIFGHRSGKRDAMTKWKKNAFRAGIVVLCGVISALGAADLDKFVALVGSFACVPLVYIYPAYLHWKGVAETRYAKIGDIVFMLVGLVAMSHEPIPSSPPTTAQPPHPTQQNTQKSSP